MHLIYHETYMLNKEGLWICSLERKCNDDDIVSLILSNFFIVFSILSFFQFKTPSQTSQCEPRDANGHRLGCAC